MSRWMREIWSRLRAVASRRKWDSDLDDELAAHIDLLTERNTQRGLPPLEARRQAVLRLGGVRATREQHQEARGLPHLEAVAQAFAHAWRAWRHAKGVALLSTTALTIGVGSATAIYTVVNAVMLRPLPYRDGDRFVALVASDTNNPSKQARFLGGDAELFQERLQAFDAFGWFREAGKNLMYAGEPRSVDGIMVTVPLVQHLGVAPILGQWFHDDTGAVISSALWRDLGADAGMIGGTLNLDGQPFTITGVMPDSFHFPAAGTTDVDVWMPLSPKERAGAAYLAYARRKPGFTLAAAAADVTRVAAEVAAERHLNQPTYTARLLDLRETVIRAIRPTLWLMFAAAGLLFLIACASASGLLLARSVARARETAMRVALGAGRARLAMQYFAEGLLVALAGAAGGIALSFTVTPAIVSIARRYLPRADEVSVDWTVLLFALAAAGMASVVASVAPLGQSVRTAPAEVLTAGARSSEGHRSRTFLQSLVVAEIALAFALLAVSAVLIGHLRGLSRTSPGFDADHLLTFVLSVPGSVARDPQQRVPLQRRFVEALRATPGVEALTLADRLPFMGCCSKAVVYPDDRPLDLSAAELSNFVAVDGGYFSAMRIPIRSGRALGDVDYREGDLSLVVNEAAARQYWNGRDPVGATGRLDSPSGPRFHVVGLVGDVKNAGLGNATVPEVYVLALFRAVESMHFAMRSSRPPSALLPDIRRVVRTIDPEQPVHAVATMRERVAETVTLERTASVLTAFFAGAALVMATLGIYGTTAYSVRRRTVEIGLRMALGATRAGVLSLILGRGLRMAAYGVLTGAVVAAAAALYLDRVFPIGDIGPAPFLYAMAIVATVAFAASLVPALRAARLSPLGAIRES